MTMMGVYTNIVKKRIEQSKEATQFPPLSNTEQKPQIASLPIKAADDTKTPQAKKSPTQSPTAHREKQNTKNLADGKTQISAVVTYEQKAVILDLESKFNRRNKVVGKGDIAGIGLDVMSRILSRPTPLFSSLEEVKEYVHKVIDKALAT